VSVKKQRGTERKWWAWEDSNLQPVDYEPNALTIELQARRVVSYDTATEEASQGPGENEEEVSGISRNAWRAGVFANGFVTRVKKRWDRR
jgi:hypothetical protein